MSTKYLTKPHDTSVIWQFNSQSDRDNQKQTRKREQKFSDAWVRDASIPTDMARTIELSLQIHTRASTWKKGADVRWRALEKKIRKKMRRRRTRK